MKPEHDWSWNSSANIGYSYHSMRFLKNDADRINMVTAEAWALAVKFHELYERIAPSFGYKTREDTRQFNCDSSNGKLMLAVCMEILVDQSEATKSFVSQEPANLVHKLQWLPIAEAPTDNAEPIILGSFDSYGQLYEIDFNGIWTAEGWISPYEIDEPTHWIYQSHIAPPTIGTPH
jgi:hypothetical protein